MQQKLESTPIISATDLQRVYGLSRTRAYEMLNRPDLPVVRIGRRKFMHAQLFNDWLEQQAKNHREA